MTPACLGALGFEQRLGVSGADFAQLALWCQRFPRPERLASLWVVRHSK